MCGICGTAGFVDRELLERMTHALTHRGPDDGGVHIEEGVHVGLGNRRLSILDLSPAGHMPMTTPDRSLVLSYNGEIYNFRELRAELVTRGHAFHTGTDSEVLLHGWLEWGRGVLPRLNGMFAFAMLDRRDGSLTLARDRYGIKPLYWTRVGEQLLFASELRALLAHERVPRSVRASAVHSYLAFLSTAGPATAFEGIEKLAPGTWLRWHEGRIETGRYHEIEYAPEPQDEGRAAAGLRDALAAAVERHLIADVPVGVFLSGGLDSSLVAALAARGGRVRAYTIAFRPEDDRLEQAGGEDARHARAVADAIGADYHEIRLEPDVAELLPFAVRHLEEPLADPAAISTYLICRAARTDVKVLLSGHGADEIFAGYRVYRNDGIARVLERVPGPVLHGPLRGLVETLPKLKNALPGVSPGLVMAAHRSLLRLIEGARLSREERYIYFRRYLTDGALDELYTPEFKARLGGADAAARQRELFAEADARDFLNRVLYVDARTFLVDHNLLYSDKMSAAASLELRVPFLDNQVTDLAARLPVDMKLRGVTGKHLLRRAAEGIVPDAVIHRRKAAFGAPVRAWLMRDLGPMLDDVLSPASVRARGIMKPEVVRRMIDDHRAGRADHTYQLWSLLTLELWHREFVDGV